MPKSTLALLDQALCNFSETYQAPALKYSYEKLSVHLEDNFKHNIVKRTPCPSGVGNYGFNSFNFLTFMVMVANVVANVNNNINNNNNNNNDINLNSITQDSNSVVSNSDNMNSIMAEILPIPVGKRRKRFITFDIKQELNDFMAKYAQDPSCEQYIVCSALEQLRENIELLDVVIGKTRLNAADCASLFPECKYSAKYYWHTTFSGTWILMAGT